ncbi:MAG: acyl-CoA carboxylase subunit epsilon [Nocardioidaceae bacterium]|nr:acyl-CoA carboxylase subunit epsilon [Nocardioidaceae bacterium]
MSVGPEVGPPLLRVVHGSPSPEELAALVTVVAARRAAARVRTTPAPRGRWGHPTSLVRAPLRPEFQPSVFRSS